MSQAGAQRATAPSVPARVPLWLAALVVVLMLLVLVLAGTLIRIKVDERRGGARDAALVALEQEAAGSDDPKLLLELGFEYRKAGLLEQALRTNRRVIRADKNNVAARYHIGSILFEMGDDKQAEKILWEGLAIDPAHAMTAKALGEFYAERGHYKSLLVAVEPAAIASPALADLQYLLGLGKEKTGDARGAAQAYWSALQSDPGLTEAREALDRVGGEQP